MEPIIVWERWVIGSDNSITVIESNIDEFKQVKPKAIQAVDTRLEWKYNYDRWVPILTANYNLIKKL